MLESSRSLTKICILRYGPQRIMKFEFEISANSKADSERFFSCPWRSGGCADEKKMAKIL
jgi:hypothetical protein